MSPVFHPQQGMDALSGRPVYGHLGHLRDRSGGGGYLSELEPVRTAGHFDLIQIGGLGFITIGSYIAVLLKKKIGLKEREAIHESVSTIELAGVVKLVRKIVMGTFAFELTGALLLSIRFVPQYGFWRGCYMGIFHAISAFCNAGFDLMGRNEAYSSLVAYEGDILVNLTIMALIIIGGAGFLVWDDIHRNRLNFKKYLLHTKIVLITTGILIFGGALLFYLMEKDNVLAGMNVRESILGSLFSSVTPRTAGFNSVDTAALKDSSKFLTMVLMFIGGSPGSTAGGVKVTTAVVMVLSTIAWCGGPMESIFWTDVWRRAR